jgi:hypothetical protein
MKKGQASLEMMVAAGLILVIFLGVYLIYVSKYADISKTKNELNEREDCLKLINAITEIFTLGKSSEITIDIDNDLNVYPAQQRIETSKTFCTFSLREIYQNSSLIDSPFTLQSGDVKIKNVYGKVLVDNV